jgi:alkylation response protein AidB-like acyl-CoA dehydrogenase
MDFSFTDDQNHLRELTAKILADRCTPEHLRATSETDSGTDLDLWRTLGEAGVVSIGWPEAAGGGGLGWLGASIVLEEIGRHAAPVPAYAVIALAGPALADASLTASGDDAAALRALLDRVASGEAIVTAAVHEVNGDLWAPATTATNGTVTGAKSFAPHGTLAAHAVVTTADGLWLVALDDPAVTVTRQDTNTAMPDAQLTFEAAPAIRLGDAAARDALLRRGMSGAAILTAGMCAAAIDLTATYAKGREQFGRPIAAFQAVSQRAGAAYIDTEAVRLTAWQAASLIDTGADAVEAVLTAKFWAAEGGWRVIHAAHHLHGGFGVDRDYPLHRYFLLMKHLELQLGSATPSLATLGAHLANP